MASSSSSHKPNFEQFALSGETRKSEKSVKVFDVFINHRGPVVKETLARDLYNSLEKLGIRAFLDSEEKEPGELFSSTIETAIWSARLHIAIFSKRYAESQWCLEELVLMRKTEVKIIPVFYEVKPSALRHIEKGVCRKENGEYDQAFNEHEKKSRYPEEKLKEWKEALHSTSLVAGYEVDKLNAADVCKKIVLAVDKQIQRIQFLHVAEHPVGLPMLVEDFERWCMKNVEGQGKARIVGICGMGGAGKTTLSKELYNRNCLKYARASFLFDVREASKRGALYSLQQKLFKDLFDLDRLSYTSTAQGRSDLHDRLRRIPSVSFLIVLDDIDDEKQLDDLLVTDMKNKPGDSLIIITTGDAGVLRTAGILGPYNLEGLNEDDARDLFCFHAFGQSNPDEGYEGLVKDFVESCGRLPLSLQVLGSHVKGTTDKKYWSSELRKLRKALPRGIKETLKISIDSLDREATEIFMDVACFFVGNSKNLAMRVWEASGWEAHHALRTLKEKFIVQEIETKRLGGLKWEWDGTDLGMHDHLRDLGREMADECRAPRRIWKPEGLKSLESKGGFRNIIDKTKGRCFHSMFETSTGYQITYFLDESASLLSVELDLISREDTCIPSWIPLQKLQCLRISNGRLQRLWESHRQAPLQLKELQISKTVLKEVPDLEILINLENVVLDAEYMSIKGWSLLESLRLNISTLTSLMPSTLEGKLSSTSWEECATLGSLIIRNFKHGTEVALNRALDRSPMSRLQNLEIGKQKSVTKILISGNHCPSLKTLKLHHMEDLIEIDLVRVRTLNSLEVNHCERIKILTFSECPELRELFLTHLSCLETVRVGNCEQLQNVSGLSDARKLVMFNINQCHQLQELYLARLSCLERIRIENCRNMKRVSVISNLAKLVELDIFLCPELESVSGLSDVRNLVMFNISHCHQLQELSLVQLSCLERVRIENCKNLKRVSVISDLSKLVELNVFLCPELESVSGLSDVSNLVMFNISQCHQLRELSLVQLICLERIIIENCKNLKSVSGISNLAKLVELNISQCPELECDLCLSNLYCLESITVGSCRKLKCLELNDCKKLVDLNICYCPELESELFLSGLSYLKRITIENCAHLKRVSGISDLTKLVELYIFECPELESKLCLSSLSCLERITVDRCRKLKCLEVIDCKKLETITGMQGLEELAILNIRGCPELLQLPAQILSCWKRMTIDGCEKLNCHAFYSLLNLNIVTFVIARAVERVESILNPHLFSKVVGANAVTEMDIPFPAKPQDSVSKIIICGLVMVERSTSVQCINYRSQEFHLRNGRWIVAMVIADPKRNISFISSAVEGMCYGILEKGFRATLLKGQEGKTRHVLQTIDDKLCQK